MKKTILIFGNGYVAKFLSEQLINQDWFVYCTSRKVESEKSTKHQNIKIINFFDSNITEIIKSANAILSTVPTDDQITDPVLANYLEIISKQRFEWIGYLSSTGVYGNHDGKWVNEHTKCTPSNFKSKLRICAEQKWLGLYLKYQIPVHIFRLAGIYGPKRNCLEEIKKGKDFTIIKKDHYFSRIHVIDICQAIIASINSPTPGEIYNVCDDEPAPINFVQQYGANILKKNPLIELLFENANLSKQFEMFFNDNKKISNNKIVSNLKIKWIYPNYRIGLLQGCLPYLEVLCESE
jgi:nucleoside-diphosphate-sugar epimerase